MRVLGALGDVSIDIFTRDGGAYLSRWAHILVGITWIGLLYFFNFVQVPAFAEMDAAARNNALDKLTWRALWWFRWAAAATFLFGVLLLLFQRDLSGDAQLFSSDYWRSYQGLSIATGILLGVTMFANVWLVIWPNQQVVIANARNVAAGGEPDPNAAAAGRRGALASRQNTIFSIPMLIFMVGTSHFPWKVLQIAKVSAGKTAVYVIIVGVIWAVLELNALGQLGGTSPGGTRVIYDTHQNALITGLVYAALSLLVFALVLST